jgi:quinol-cytochrome oxidoreductase complex cytochrome b subunit
MKKWLLANIFLDILFRFSILILFCYDSIDEDNLLSPYRDKSITPYFIIFV